LGGFREEVIWRYSDNTATGAGVDADHEVSEAFDGDQREDDGFVALCPELDMASEGVSIEEARVNLIEALTLFFETAADWVDSGSFRAQRFVGSLNRTDSRQSGNEVATESCKSVRKALR
jgi:hypothetical protein